MATLRQKLAAKKIVENSRNPVKSAGNILREVGYSEATAIKPSQVTESKGFRELLEEQFPIDKANKALAEIIDSNIGDPATTPTLRLRYELGGHLNKNGVGNLIQNNIKIVTEQKKKYDL